MNTCNDLKNSAAAKYNHKVEVAHLNGILAMAETLLELSNDPDSYQFAACFLYEVEQSVKSRLTELAE